MKYENKISDLALNSLKFYSGKNTPEFISFDKPKEVDKITKGEIYSFINENDNEEIGECVDYNEKTGKVTLKKL